MPYDPQWPQNGQNIDADRFRGQFSSLKTLIDALTSINAAQIDSVTTGNPGDPASVSVNVIGSTLGFSFSLPRGQEGVAGQAGSNGSDGGQGPMGEVSNAALAGAINGTSSNSNAVTTMGLVVSDPPTQAEMQSLANKMDELILTLRR